MKKFNIIPVYTDETASCFNTKLRPGIILTDIDGVLIRTAPLMPGKEISLLGISKNEEQNDSINSVFLDTVFIKIGSEEHFFDVIDFPSARFVQDTESPDNLRLLFKKNNLVINHSALSILLTRSTLFSRYDDRFDLFEFDIEIEGFLNQKTSAISVVSKSLKIATVKKDGKECDPELIQRVKQDLEPTLSFEGYYIKAQRYSPA